MRRSTVRQRLDKALKKAQDAMSTYQEAVKTEQAACKHPVNAQVETRGKEGILRYYPPTHLCTLCGLRVEGWNYGDLGQHHSGLREVTDDEARALQHGGMK